MENYPTIFQSNSSLLINMVNSDAPEQQYGGGEFQLEHMPATINNTSTTTNGMENDDDDDQEEKKKGEKKLKKPKYAFQTRSQVDILDDGYRWRKYGQKAVKNNKFPRSYYRCTHEGCNVKKQVQRLSKDEGIVVTTYEGMHSHQIHNTTHNFQHILSQMQIYNSF